MQELTGCLPGGKFETLTGKTIAITGGASGFGRLMAIKCAKLGATVIISDVNTAMCAQTAAEASVGTGRCIAMPDPCDVTRTESQESFFEFVNKTLGHMPDVVVCNAGVTELGRVTETRSMTSNDLGPLPHPPNMKTLQINYNGMLLTAELAVRGWEDEAAPSGGRRKRGPGKIILLASMGEKTVGSESFEMMYPSIVSLPTLTKPSGQISACPGAETYCWSKHAMIGYWLATCETIRKQKEQGNQLYSCDAICPFFSVTAILDPAILCFLAGLAKVAPDTIAACVVALMNRHLEIGSAVMLPDDKDPWITSDLDFKGSLKQDWEVVLAKRSGDRVGRKEYWQRLGGDIGFAFGLSPIKLAKVVAVSVAACIALLIVNRSVESLNAIWALGLGASAAIAAKAVPRAPKSGARR